MPSHAAHVALQHHFDDLDQQKEASTFGMWVFLVTEILFFGGLFTTYVIYRQRFHGVFVEASRHLDVKWGGINTAVLITSSLTMALAIWSAQVNRRKLIVVFLLLTMVLGSVFLGIKVVEYGDKFTHHLVPGVNFQYAGEHPEQAEMFFSLYFCMTGLHALHMVIGVTLLGVLIYPSWKGRYSAAWHNPLECSGLYWHFVDIVWIFLFPLLYLIGRHVS
ncbi:MAG TPA: cytochrome c oxidase subunit 3 family protein [Thermoanaerobaculia bacterium]|nr:cytochrome c oxidase subunit 3 family protein [Thermoanaerobaculia bacterium]